MIETNEAIVQLYEHTEGQGPPLVFIHGWAASHRFWKYQIPLFAQSNLVIAYDLRGHGDSEKPAHGYSIRDHIQDLESILATQQISNPVLIGHSLGGMIALQATLDELVNPRGLVLVGTSPHPVATFKRNLEFSLLQFLIRISRKRAAKFTEKALFAPDVNQELVEWVNAESMRTPTYVILEILQHVKDFNVVSRLSEIQVPALIITGEYESAVDQQLLDRMVELIPQVRYEVISGAGHNCMLENHTIFNSIVESFLQELYE
ncbi:MAG: alpha/beta fold hydrolase [Promethearchaeota archaeon]